jgi:hypothetical protein
MCAYLATWSHDVWTWRTRHSKGEIQGDVTYLHILGQGLVFLSGDALVDLLDKRGSIHPDRAKLTMAGEL